MEWLLTRETVIALAILGALPSVAAALLRNGGKLTERQAQRLNLAGYGFMAASMALFIVIGFRS